MTIFKSLNTISGIVKNPHIPRCGIASVNDDNLDECEVQSLVDEFIQEGIAYYLSSAQLELQKKLDEGEISEEEFEYENDFIEIDEETYYLGYTFENGVLIEREDSPIHASYSCSSNIISVFKSKHIAFCGVTSPCFVLVNGNGPCGDLSSITARYNQDALIAYCLPRECYKNEKLVHDIENEKVLARAVCGVEAKDEISWGDLIDLEYRGRIDNLSEAMAVNLHKVLKNNYMLEVSDDNLELFSIVEIE